MSQCRGLTRDCDGERTQRCRLGATIDGYCKLHYPGAQAMSGRSDEEIAGAVWKERWGGHLDETIGEYEVALVAAGRAEGRQEYQLKLRYLQQGVADLRAERDELAEAVLRLNKMGLRAERRGWIEALTWALTQFLSTDGTAYKSIRARLREVEKMATGGDNDSRLESASGSPAGSIRSLPLPVSIPADHPEATCEWCGSVNVTWHAPNDVWNETFRRAGARREEPSVICPTCFVRAAEEAGVSTASWLVQP